MKTFKYASDFTKYVRNAWLAGMTQAELLEQLIVHQDYLVTASMNRTMQAMYSIRKDRLAKPIPLNPSPLYLDNRNIKKVR